MEYETIGALGSLIGVGDLAAIAEMSQWVNRYVLDGISTGSRSPSPWSATRTAS